MGAAFPLRGRIGHVAPPSPQPAFAIGDRVHHTVTLVGDGPDEALLECGIVVAMRRDPVMGWDCDVMFWPPGVIPSPTSPRPLEGALRYAESSLRRGWPDG